MKSNAQLIAELMRIKRNSYSFGDTVKIFILGALVGALAMAMLT